MLERTFPRQHSTRPLELGGTRTLLTQISSRRPSSDSPLSEGHARALDLGAVADREHTGPGTLAKAVALDDEASGGRIDRMPTAQQPGEIDRWQEAITEADRVHLEGSFCTRQRPPSGIDLRHRYRLGAFLAFDTEQTVAVEHRDAVLAEDTEECKAPTHEIRRRMPSPD